MREVINDPLFIKAFFLLVSFFGSVLTGIVTYFLGSLIKDLKANDKLFLKKLTGIEKKLVAVEKDIESLDEKSVKIESIDQRVHELEGHSFEFRKFIENN